MPGRIGGYFLFELVFLKGNFPRLYARFNTTYNSLGIFTSTCLDFHSLFLLLICEARYLHSTSWIGYSLFSRLKR